MENTPTISARPLMPDVLCLLLSIYCEDQHDTDFKLSHERRQLDVLVVLGLVQMSKCIWSATPKGRAHVTTCCSLALPVVWPTTFFGAPIA
jgi:hypothetical protein